MRNFFKNIGIWLVLFFLLDLFFIFIAWILRPDAILSIALLILLFTLLVLPAGYFFQKHSQHKKITAMLDFLENLTESKKETLFFLTETSLHPVITAYHTQMQIQNSALNKSQIELQNYQEYIEAWTHEIKTPLTLMALLLDNHKEDLTPYMQTRLEHIKYQLNGNVSRILYYARLQTDHKDYHFTHFMLSTCITDILEDFTPLLEEKQITLHTKIQPLSVFADRNVVSFMLSQLLSNAIQYADSNSGTITITLEEDKKLQTICLTIQDNGKGVSPGDLPFIFDKGFTGNHPERQKATGMGLYFANQYAKALNLTLQAKPNADSSSGFVIQLLFPIVP